MTPESTLPRDREWIVARPLSHSVAIPGQRAAARRPRPAPYPPPPGFTLIELVVTLVLVGILAAVVLPRFMGRGTYAARAAQDQLISAARYAQQVAMIKGPGAQVHFVLNQATYQIELAGVPLTLPGTDATHKTLTDVRTTNANLAYTSLGNTTATTITLTGRAMTRRVCISATGFAYAC